MEAIFEPFYQIGNPERAPEKGHGLGLSIARGMATMMGVQIDARSRVGHGSAFGVTVPVRATGTRADALAVAVAPEASVGSPLILLVEDMAIVRESTRDLLEAWGCRVIAAADGAQALAAAAQVSEPIECVITDLRLPGALDGFGVVRALRARAQGNLPAILISADPAVSGGDAEGVHKLTKPVAPSRLQATLLAVLGATRPDASALSVSAEPQS